MDSRVIVPAPAARRPPPPPPPGLALARNRPGRTRLAFGAGIRGWPVRSTACELRSRSAAYSRPATLRPRRRRYCRCQPQPPQPSDSTAQPNTRGSSYDGRAARPMGGGGSPRARRGGGTSGRGGRGVKRAGRSGARRARPRVRLRRRGKGDAQLGAGRDRPGLWECGGLGHQARLCSAPFVPARLCSALLRWRAGGKDPANVVAGFGYPGPMGNTGVPCFMVSRETPWHCLIGKYLPLIHS